MNNGRERDGIKLRKHNHSQLCTDFGGEWQWEMIDLNTFVRHFCLFLLFKKIAKEKSTQDTNQTQLTIKFINLTKDLTFPEANILAKRLTDRQNSINKNY